MKLSEAKDYLRQEILSVINEEFNLHENAGEDDYKNLADELEALADKAEEMGDDTLAKQIRNQISYANKEAVKLASGEGTDTSDMDMGIGMDMDMDGEGEEGLDIEDLEDLEDEEESKDDKKDKKKKKIKEALRQEILKTLK